MALDADQVRRLLETDPGITGVTQGDNVLGSYINARLSDGRAVQINLHDNPAWKDRDELTGRIEVVYANRPQTEWRFDDDDLAAREPVVIDPVDAEAAGKLTQTIRAWEREGGPAATKIETDRDTETPPAMEYAYRWHNPNGPGWHIEYADTVEERDTALKLRRDAGLVTQTIDEDPYVLREQHIKASCMNARHILEPRDVPDKATVGLLRDIVREINEHDPADETGHLIIYQSADAARLAGEGLTADDIADKRLHGGWDPATDPYMRIDEQGDWTGITEQQADQLIWERRDQILEHASRDDALSRTTLRRLDRLADTDRERVPERGDRDRENPGPGTAQPRRHGPAL